MAKLPDATVLGSLGSLDSGRTYDITGSAKGMEHAAHTEAQRSALITKGYDALGTGVEALGKGFTDLELRKREFENARANAQFRADAIDLDSAFADDKNYVDLLPRYEKALNEVKERAAGTISSTAGRERFDFSLEPAFRQRVATMKEQARNLENHTQNGYRLELGDKLLNQAAIADEKTSRENMIAYRDLVDGAIRVGHTPPEQGYREKRDWTQKFLFARGKSQTEADPEGVLKVLEAPGSGSVYDFLDPESRLALRDYVNTRSDRARRQAAADQKKTADDLSEVNLKEAHFRGSKGTLTEDFIESIRSSVSARDYKGLRQSLTAEDNIDDKNALADLVPRIDTTDPNEFQKLATSYLDQGKLKGSTYISLSEKNRSASKDDQPDSPYRSGRSLISTVLNPGDLLSGSAATIARHGQAQALLEYDNWTKANPRADRSETVAQAQDIIRRYIVVDTSNMKLATGMSRYFGAKSRNDITTADVNLAQERLFSDKTLTKEQRAFEVRLLDAWYDIVTREESAKKEQPRGGPKRK